MPDATKSKLITSPWRVVEVFVLFLVASTIGEFTGAFMGEGAQLTLAIIELAIGLALAWPALSGKRWAYVLLGLYLIYYGLCTFWLLLEGGAETLIMIYHGPLSAFFAAGGLKLMLTKPKTSENSTE